MTDSATLVANPTAGQTKATPKEFADKLNNVVVLIGHVCILNRPTASVRGKPMLKVCLAVKRADNGFLPKKIREDGSEEPDYPWIAAAGNLATWLSENLRLGDRLTIHGALTTRNVSGNEMVLYGSLLQQLRTLLVQIQIDELLNLGAEIPVSLNHNDIPEALDAFLPQGDRAPIHQVARFLSEYLASSAKVRKRVVVEVAPISITITHRDEEKQLIAKVEPGDFEVGVLPNPTASMSDETAAPSGSEFPESTAQPSIDPTKKKKRHGKHSPIAQEPVV
jgi:hypothetical protein